MPKTKIYVYCSPTGRDQRGTGIKDSNGFLIAPNSEVFGNALSEDGQYCGSHLSSNESYSKHDMGITSDWKHEIYAAKFPDGYELIWLGKLQEPRDNAELLRAYLKYAASLTDEHRSNLPEWVQTMLAENAKEAPDA